MFSEVNVFDRLLYVLVIGVFFLAIAVPMISLFTERTCNYCKKRIRKEATVCPYCTRQLAEQDKTV